MQSVPGAIATGSARLRYPFYPVAIAPGTDSCLASRLARDYTQMRSSHTDLRIDSHTNDHSLSGQGFRFAIVASRWNDSIVSRLTAGAVEALQEASVDERDIEIYHVPGSFELALCALKAAESRKFAAVICLGVVIRGETPHFDFVAAEAARGISEVSLRTGVPVMFGVITANTVEQANARAGAKHDNKGFEAALAALDVVNLYREAFDQKS